MKNKASTIRTKQVWELLASAGIAVSGILVLCVFMIMASASMPFAIFFNRHVFLFVVLFLIIFAVLTIASFLMLTRKRIIYLEEITETLDRISAGDLNIQIPVRTADELGRMAETVNDMAYKLKAAIEEERKTEKAKNDLITNMSHDLRTPLTSTLGYLDLLAHMDYNEKDKLKQYSSIAYDQCKDLKILIDDLFEFSKLSNPGMSINKTRVNLGELIEQVLLGFIPALEKAGMEYRLFFPDKRISICADPLLLTRVFDNLINNAIKYGSEGKYLDVELSGADGEATVEVKNYGNPIPAPDLPFIFERLYRVDKARSVQDGSSGLGLAIVKSIVELHGGTLGVNSMDEVTVFKVKLKDR